MNWFIKCVTKDYFNFSGRARRKEYWFYQLITFLIPFILGIICRIFGINVGGGFISFLLLILTLGLLIPGLVVLVRRLHDTGRSGWWFFIALIPFVGYIILFIFALLDSEPGDNQYGENPKGVE